MQKNILLIAQTIDPYKGSEFQSTWGFVRDIYFDIIRECSFKLTIVYSINEGNCENIMSEIPSDIIDRVELIGVPQVLPSMHKYCSKILKYLWGVKVYVLLKNKVNSYDIIHQVSPNSLPYLNKIIEFSTRNNKRTLVGPMRSSEYAGIREFYKGCIFTFGYQVYARFLNIVERVVFYKKNKLLKKVDLHLDPINFSNNSNHYYCPETLNVFKELDENTVINKVVSSSLDIVRVIFICGGERHRKNEQLAIRIIEDYIKVEGQTNIEFEFFGHNLCDKKSQINYRGKVSRERFLKAIDSNTIYLCTSYLELNSLAAHEVLSRGGLVVCGSLPGFNSLSSSQVFINEDYNNINMWVKQLSDSIACIDSGTNYIEHMTHIRNDVIRKIEEVLGI